jgi:hypothetical protein
MRSWMRHWLCSLVLPAILILAGCVANDPNAVRTAGGQVIGSEQWRPITAGESRLSFNNPPAAVLSFEERAFSTRVQQAYRTARGAMLFEQSGTNAAFGQVGDTSLRILEITLTDNELRARGISARMDSVRRGRVSSGPYAFVQASSSGAAIQCSIFQLMFESSIRNYDNGAMYQAYLRGYWCGLTGQTREQVDSDTQAFLQSILFDGGALNRARASSPPTNAPQASPGPQPAPATAIPSTTPQERSISPAQSTPQQPIQRDVETRLRELNRLRDGGLITPQEYEARRRAILEAL